MKFLVLLAVLAIAYMVWRNGRVAERKAPPPKAPRAPAAPQDMVQCRACGVHLPRGEALAGPDGSLFCCAEHRKSAG